MTSDLIKLENWNQLARLDSGNGVPMPFVQELFLIECEIAGTGFVKNIAEKAAALNDDEALSLIREAGNKYDSLAIRVDNSKGEKLGYIPRKNNEILARLLDGGKILYGKVAERKVTEYSNWVDITVKVYMKDL